MGAAFNKLWSEFYEKAEDKPVAIGSKSRPLRLYSRCSPASKSRSASCVLLWRHLASPGGAFHVDGWHLVL